MAEPYIIVEDLSKSFSNGASKVEVLQDLNFTVTKGDSLAVVGSSGVGKSTLLYLLGALEKPTSGRVVLDGIDLGQQDDKKLADIRNKKIGFVFQFHHLLLEFNALENAAMPAMIAKMNRRDALDRAEHILTRVGLSKRLKHRVGELSGGEQQRVALARSLVLSPEVLLADEPTGNLDSRTGGLINDLLVEMNEEWGLTIIVVTHNLNLARMMGRQLSLIDGRAIEER